MVRIGINLLDLVPGKIGGMEQYIRNVIWYITNNYEKYDIYLFLKSSNYDSFEQYENLKRIIISENQNREIEMYSCIEELELDIWFCPLLVLEPKFVHIPTVVTIPDIQHEFYPEFFDKSVLEWRNEKFNSSVSKADIIITISNFSRDTIIKKYNVDDSKVRRIYLDADKEFYKSIDYKYSEEVKLKYNLPKNYIFYPANTWPHKNHLNLLEAFKLFKNDNNCDLKLLFTGSADKAQNNIKKFIRENKLNKYVVFLGYIDQKDMPYIYLNALFLVFPSLFEGFGIPLVEAMRMKCPILCSNVGSIPEVAGDCAEFFDPKSPKDICEKIMKMMDSDARRILIEKGKIHSKRFSWEKSCRETVDIFNDLIYKNRNKNDQNKYPLVSIITPSYNQGKFIRETIESVLNQDYPNIEYIVMDGGSSDETVEILKEYDNRIKWISEKDGGQADAVNRGIEMSSGEIIGWLNSDDTYMPGAIRKAVEFLQKNNEVGMVYGEGYYTSTSSEIISRYPTETFNYDRLAEICFICQPTVFARKNVLIDVGMLDKKLHLCMDYELWMKIGKKHVVGYIPQYLANSRMYEENKTLGRRDEVFKEVIKTVKKYYNYVPISWIYGYVDYIMKGKRGIGFNLRIIFKFISYNYSNLHYSINVSKNLVKSKIKQRYKPESFTGRYEDGWVSKVYIANKFIKSAEKDSRLVISGRNLSPFKDPIKIKIYIGSELIGTKDLIEKGEFEFTLDISNTIGMKEINIQMISNKVFCPKKLGINNDIRYLSYIIDELTTK